MNIYIYKRYSDSHYAHPDLYHEKLIDNVVFKEDGALDVVNPRVVCDISGFDEINKMNGYNFMYIPQLRSYYWMKFHTEGGLIVFEGERDPMYTFWGDIKGSTQYISRSQTMRNKYIVDNSLPIHSQHNYLIKNIGSPVYDKSCNAVILETVGKGGTPT